MLESRHHSHRCFVGGNSAFRACRVERISNREAVCARYATEPVRFDAGSQRVSHGLGLLPCAKQQRLRHHQPNRIPNRESRAGLWGNYSCAQYKDAGRATAAQCESGGRRYLGGSKQLDAAFSSSDAPRVCDTPSRIVSLLVVYSAGWRSTWNVWLSRRGARASG